MKILNRRVPIGNFENADEEDIYFLSESLDSLKDLFISGEWSECFGVVATNLECDDRFTDFVSDYLDETPIISGEGKLVLREFNSVYLEFVKSYPGSYSNMRDDKVHSDPRWPNLKTLGCKAIEHIEKGLERYK